MRSYPVCFVGRRHGVGDDTPVQVLAGRGGRSRNVPDVARLLVHVVHEHPFLDDNLYYRLATSKTADAVDLAQALAADRSRRSADRGSQPPGQDLSCWIGAEAVDRLVQWHGIARHDAWIVLHRLMQFGLVAHVAQARPVIDGHFFYRFTGLPADGVR